MNAHKFAAAMLRAQLALRAIGPVAAAAAVLLLAAAVVIAVLVPRRAELARANQAALAAAAHPSAVVVAAPPPSANDNLDLFYRSLGERRYAEQQVRTLFGLAAKSGLTLAQGEYRSAYDQNARLYTYQVVLPVKGSYKAVWAFAMGALRAIPFASLDDVSFRRDTIGDTSVDARVRLTLYLA
ncbi:MAG TPA: hypothetical protein VFF16_13880, partial [Telluria sp.]|nr:hypothetical protein [Telluria sp.]